MCYSRHPEDRRGESRVAAALPVYLSGQSAQSGHDSQNRGLDSASREKHVVWYEILSSSTAMLTSQMLTSQIIGHVRKLFFLVRMRSVLEGSKSILKGKES